MAGSRVSPIPFLDRFTHYIRIDFSCRQIDEEHPHELVQALRHHTQSLCKQLVSGTHNTQNAEVKVYLHPAAFVTCEADAIISRDAHQDRGTFLLGLEPAPSDEDDIKDLLSSWVDEVKTTTLFIDYIPPPSLAARLVHKQDLGRMLIPASHICPALFPADHSITIYNSTSTSPETITERAGSPAAAAAAIERSPSPKKALTPFPAILSRLKWDPAFDAGDYVVVYEDRHAGLVECKLEAWTVESTEETFVPMHRVRAVRKERTGMVVWHREGRIDLVSGS